MTKLVNLKKPAKLAAATTGGDDYLVERVILTPTQAAEWLKANKHNRPVRRRHVTFLASEIESGHWQANGQPIVISDTDDVLDGQHRLMAVIEAGIDIEVLVVYGIKKEAFKTIDTGIKRTGGDAVILHFHGRQLTVAKAVAQAVPTCLLIEGENFSRRFSISNTDVIEYVEAHPSLWNCAEEISTLGRTGRPMSLPIGTAFYEVIQRHHPELAEEFVRGLFTGELLESGSPEYVLRQILESNNRSIRKFDRFTIVQMCVKAFNLKIRKLTGVTRRQIAIEANDSRVVKILGKKTSKE